MSLLDTVQMKCKHCGSIFEQAVWSSVNTDNPELTQKLMSGDIFTRMCPRCGTSSYSEYPILFNDLENSLMIYIVPDEDMYQETEKVFTTISSVRSLNYRCRIVKNHRNFKEKIAIFHAGRDDRIVEIYKYLCKVNFMESHPNIDIKDIMYSNEQEEVILIQSSNNKSWEYEVSEEIYDNFKEIFIEEINDPINCTFHYDLNWAEQIVNQIRDTDEELEEASAPNDTQYDSFTEDNTEESQNICFSESEIHFIKDYYEEALNGDAIAQFRLSGSYETNLEYCVRLDENDAQYKAIYWLKQSARNGFSFAQETLALKYDLGDPYLPKDKKLAAFWYKKAANQGNINSMTRLAEFYRDGIGVERNQKISFHWYKLAADNNDALSQWIVAGMLETGNGVEKDINQALMYHTKAAQNGLVDAQKTLGKIYFEGIGVPQDIETAIYWYQLAANQDDEDAQDELSYITDMIFEEKKIKNQRESLNYLIQDINDWNINYSIILKRVMNQTLGQQINYETLTHELQNLTKQAEVHAATAIGFKSFFASCVTENLEEEMALSDILYEYQKSKLESITILTKLVYGLQKMAKGAIFGYSMRKYKKDRENLLAQEEASAILGKQLSATMEDCTFLTSI